MSRSLRNSCLKCLSTHTCCVIPNNMWECPGKVTITKHKPSKAPEEGEMRNIYKDKQNHIWKHRRTNKEELHQRRCLRMVSRETSADGLKPVLFARNRRKAAFILQFVSEKFVLYRKNSKYWDRRAWASRAIHRGVWSVNTVCHALWVCLLHSSGTPFISYCPNIRTSMVRR